jgi:hypothetical protein
MNDEYNFEDEDLDRGVDSIINQIKSQSNSVNLVKKEHPELKREELEDFVIQKTSSIINDCCDMVQGLKLDVEAGGDSKMVESTATLVNALVNAVNTLSKIQLAENSHKNKKEIEQMKIDAKISTEENSLLGNKSGVFISREDLLKEMFKRSNIEDSKKDDDDGAAGMLVEV